MNTGSQLKNAAPKSTPIQKVPKQKAAIINRNIGREYQTFTAIKVPMANPATVRNRTNNRNEIMY